MLDQTDRVRDLAYQLWERDGRPAGREIEHWLEAERHLIHAAPAGPEANTRAPAPRKRRAAKKA